MLHWVNIHQLEALRPEHYLKTVYTFDYLVLVTLKIRVQQEVNFLCRGTTAKLEIWVTLLKAMAIFVFEEPKQALTLLVSKMATVG